jgi:hydrogenase maturation factor
VTCSDEAVVARVLEVDGLEALVQVADGRHQRVAVDLVGDVREGERLLCHAGIALERVVAA